MAAPAPYTDWVFDVRRANEAGKMERFAELTRKSPDFARIWFYGHIFDLVTVGIPEAEKEALRPRLKQIANVLATKEKTLVHAISNITVKNKSISNIMV